MKLACDYTELFLSSSSGISLTLAKRNFGIVDPKIILYLEAAPVVADAPGAFVDVFAKQGSDPHPVDSISVFTDGEWVWTNEATYYYREYGLELEPQFIQHILEKKYQPPSVVGDEQINEIVAQYFDVA